MVHIFEKRFKAKDSLNDIRAENYNLFGLHKKEIFDANGDLIRLEYYSDYDPVNDIFSGLAIKEERTYTRDAGTGLLLSRITIITWYDIDGGVAATKSDVTKYYSAKKGFSANKRSRGNIVEQASMYLYSALIANDPLTAEANVDDFQDMTDSAVSKYIKSNTQPLLDIITNSTDVNAPEYRDYMTAAMRDTLLSILNISYT